MREFEKLNLASQNIADEKLARLKDLFPEIFTEGNKIDFDRLKLTLGESLDEGRERFGINWPGKAACFRTMQQPSMGTLIPCREESAGFDSASNLFIEGDNLEVLKLLQRSYHGKVKMIYIDPPYNTGKDFVYPDDYSDNLKNYRQYSGQADSEGKLFTNNTDREGRFHSKWLSMMYPRLFLARNLLKEDGVIFISIDDNEVHNLRAICNEIFGEENFISTICIQSNPRGRQSDTFVASVHDYIMVYTKNSNNSILKGSPLTEDQKSEFKYKDINGEPYRLLGLRQRGSESKREDRPDMYFPIFVNPDSLEVSLENQNGWETVYPKKSDGSDGRWMWGLDKCINDISLLVPRMIERRKEYDIFVIDYLNRGENERTRKYKSVWSDKEYNNQAGTLEVKSILQSDAMTFPKPKYLIKNVCIMGLDREDIILDFFAGSCTTAHAVMELNKEDGGSRKYICVQLPEPTDPNGEAYKAGYKTVAEIGKERIRRAAAKIKEELAQKEEKASGDIFKEEDKPEPDLGFKVFKLERSCFLPWNNSAGQSEEDIKIQLELNVNPVNAERRPEDLLAEILLKSGFELTAAIETLALAGKTVYSVEGGLLHVCLEKQLTMEALRSMAELKPGRIVCLDSGFNGDDGLKTNTALLMKDKEIEFRTV